jgi:hypothetical protein
MAEQKTRQSDSSVPFWGILFLFLGLVFLLQTLDVLPWGLWRTLWRLWPVLLIALGICLAMRRFNVWLVSLIVAALFAGVLGIAYAQYQSAPSEQPTILTSSEPLDSLNGAQVDIDFEAGNLDIGSLPVASRNFIEANMKPDVRRQGNSAIVTINRSGTGWPFWDEGRDRWRVGFARGIPMIVNAKLNMTNTGFDLTDLQVSELRIDSDLTNCNLRMPSSGITSASIKVDLSTLEIIIPQGVAARMLIQGDLTPVNVDSRRFLLKDGYYVSSDFDTAKNRVEQQIDADLSVVEVK